MKTVTEKQARIIFYLAGAGILLGGILGAICVYEPMLSAVFYAIFFVSFAIIVTICFDAKIETES